MNTEQEFQLIDRILAGEEELYRKLVDQYKRYAYTIAVRILLNRPDAEEAAQDAFIKAYRSLKDFTRQSKFSTWLYRIVFNTAVSYKRKQRNPLHSLDAAGDEAAEWTSPAEQHDKEKFLHMALNRLKEADRMAISLFYLKEFSLEEIGEIMETDPNTIKVRIHRARIKLADELRALLSKEALTL
jgi:RNA polymerase sigma-70 factor (ECF subfamily)